MSRNKYWLLSIGHKEIYGSAGLSLDEIKSELGRYDLNSMLELSAKIGVILFNTAGDISLLQHGQVNMIRSFYDNEAERKDFERRLNQVIYRLQIPKNGWGLYTKNSILLFLKIALENCPPTGGKPMSLEVAPVISKILLSITDYLNEQDFQTPKILLPKVEMSRKLREYIFRRLNFSDNQKYPNPLYRQLKIINFLKAQRNGAMFAKHFKDATGVSLKTYFEAGAMLTAHWGVPNRDFKLNDAWHVRREYLSNTKLHKAEVKKLYDLLVFNPDTYESQYANSVKILSEKDIYTYNYLFLMQTPLVPILDKLLTCPSPEYLINKVTEGAYRIVSDYLRKGGTQNEELKKKYNHLPQYWGKAFESYAHLRLKNTFGKNYRKIKEEDRKRADGLFEGKETIILFEYKSIHPSYKALITGSAQDLEKPYEQCFGKKHGIVQMTSHAEDIQTGKFKLRSTLKDKKILPVLVISEYLPSEPLHYKFFRELLAANLVNYNKNYLLPFIYLTIEEAEYLEALAAEKNVDELEQLLVDFSRKIHNLDLENDLSFKNFIFSKGISVPTNKTIMDGYETYTDKLLRHHFPIEYKKGFPPNKKMPKNGHLS